MYRHRHGLGDIFDDIDSITRTARTVHGQADAILSGDRKLTTVPSDAAYLSIPLPGRPVGVSLPLMPIALGLGAMVVLGVFRSKRR